MEIQLKWRTLERHDRVSRRSYLCFLDDGCDTIIVFVTTCIMRIVVADIVNDISEWSVNIPFKTIIVLFQNIWEHMKLISHVICFQINNMYFV